MFPNCFLEASAVSPGGKPIAVGFPADIAATAAQMGSFAAIAATAAQMGSSAATGCYCCSDGFFC
jgi:hypothetical protein